MSHTPAPLLAAANTRQSFEVAAPAPSYACNPCVGYASASVCCTSDLAADQYFLIYARSQTADLSCEVEIICGITGAASPDRRHTEGQPGAPLPRQRAHLLRAHPPLLLYPSGSRCHAAPGRAICGCPRWLHPLRGCGGSRRLRRRPGPAMRPGVGSRESGRSECFALQYSTQTYSVFRMTQDLGLERGSRRDRIILPEVDET